MTVTVACLLATRLHDKLVSFRADSCCCVTTGAVTGWFDLGQYRQLSLNVLTGEWRNNITETTGYLNQTQDLRFWVLTQFTAALSFQSEQRRLMNYSPLPAFSPSFNEGHQ